MSKTTWLLAGSIGFLMGSRAGHGPYEAFARQVSRVKSDPRVQAKAAEAGDLAKHKAAEAASTARGKVEDALSSDSDAPAGYGHSAAPQGDLP